MELTAVAPAGAAVPEPGARVGLAWAPAALHADGGGVMATAERAPAPGSPSDLSDALLAPPPLSC